MSVTLRAGRRLVEITRPDKPLFGSGATKGDLACYYLEVSKAMLPHLARRPLTLERYPEGIEGPRVIQQHAEHLPAWLARVEAPAREGGRVEHVLARDAATLVYLADLECVTFHRWLSRSDMLERPDLVVFDLDPSAPDPAAIRRAALVLGGLLRELRLEPWAMTTGSRGYHVVAKLRRQATFDAVREFAEGVAELAVRRDPRLFTNAQRKNEREGKILIDVMRNAYGQTAVAPYSVRARPQAPVATPLSWGELEEASTTATRWTLASIPGRLEAQGDPWAQMGRHAQTLSRPAARLGEALGETRAGRT